MIFIGVAVVGALIGCGGPPDRPVTDSAARNVASAFTSELFSRNPERAFQRLAPDAEAPPVFRRKILENLRARRYAQNGHVAVADSAFVFPYEALGKDGRTGMATREIGDLKVWVRRSGHRRVISAFDFEFHSVEFTSPSAG